MTTLKKADHTPNGKSGQPSPRTYIVTLATKEGRRRLKIAVKPHSAHLTSMNFQYASQHARKQRFRSILKGAGSIVALMPSPPPLLRRSAIGSFAETNRRVVHTWNRAFQAAKE